MLRSGTFKWLDREGSVLMNGLIHSWVDGLMGSWINGFNGSRVSGFLRKEERPKQAC